MWFQVNQENKWPKLLNINHMNEITIEAEETTAELHHVVFQSLGAKPRSRELAFKVKLYSGSLAKCIEIMDRLIDHIAHGKPLFVVTEMS